MTYNITTKSWLPCRTSKSYGFYPTTKYIGIITDEQGRFVAETGKCASHKAAYHAAHRKLTQLGLYAA